MYTEPNMSLTVWNLLTDLFDHNALADNFVAIGAHDHSTGKGVQINTAGIANGAITAAQIANGAVGTQQLAASVSGVLLPSGAMLDFAGTAAPTGFLLCDGSVYQQSAYPNLFQAIGSDWNTGSEASGYFRVPNSLGRVSVGAGAGANLTSRALAQNGGEEAHTLLEAELAAHSHGGATGGQNVDHTHTYNGTTSGESGHYHGAGATVEGSATTFLMGGPNTPAATNLASGTSYNIGLAYDTGGSSGHTHTYSGGTSTESTTHAHSISSDGSNTAHNNMQPFFVVTKIIKY